MFALSSYLVAVTEYPNIEFIRKILRSRLLSSRLLEGLLSRTRLGERAIEGWY